MRFARGGTGGARGCHGCSAVGRSSALWHAQRIAHRHVRRPRESPRSHAGQQCFVPTHMAHRRAAVFGIERTIPQEGPCCDRAECWSDVSGDVYEGAGNPRLPRILPACESRRVSAICAVPLPAWNIRFSVSSVALHRHPGAHRGRRGSDDRGGGQGPGCSRRDIRMTTHSQMVAERAAQLLSVEGKVAVVTGAASGIGRGIALLLAEMGASVAIFDVNEQRGGETATAVGAQRGNAAFVKCDVRSADDCRQAVETVIAKWSRIDVLCNCAGIAIRKDVVDLAEDEWDRALDVTLKGIFLLSREVIPHMIRAGGGGIVNIGSGWSLKGGPKAASYCAAKGGVVNLTRAMAIDHGMHNIRVNCVCPGDVDTPMLRSECEQLSENSQTFMKAAANRPIARVGTPADIANAVLFLVSPMATWITGTALVVDGGGLA